jgi:hypothetical protein
LQGFCTAGLAHAPIMRQLRLSHLFRQAQQRLALHERGGVAQVGERARADVLRVSRAEGGFAACVGLGVGTERSRG